MSPSQSSSSIGNEGRKMTSFELFSNVLISLTGTVVLGIGSKMQQGGWILPPLMLVIGAAIVAEMVWVISTTIDVRCKEEGCEPPRSYKDYAAMALGVPGEVLASVTSTFSLFSMICGGMIVLAQNMQAVAPIQSWPGGQEVGQKWWALILTAETLLFCFVDLSKLLDKSALLGPFVTAGVFVLVFWGCAQALNTLNTEFPEECRSGTQDFTTVLPENDRGFMGLVSDLAQMGSYSIFVFAIVVTVPTLKSETAKPKRLVPASVLAFALALILFLGVMISYYAAFGNLGPENIIQAMRTDRPAGWWATSQPWQTGKETAIGQTLAWLVNVHLCLSDVVYVGCTVIAFEELVPRNCRGTWASWFLVRIGLSIARTLVATLITSFTTLSSLTGSLFVVCNNILVPIIGFYAVCGSSRAGPTRMSLHVLIFLFGVYMVVAGTWSSIQSLISEAASPEHIGVFPRAGLSVECMATYNLTVHGQ